MTEQLGESAQVMFFRPAGAIALVCASPTFAPGETSKTVAVPVYGDRLAEANESSGDAARGAARSRGCNCGLWPGCSLGYD
jgi:hypothetical protein